jgi:hypothetical protein
MIAGARTRPALPERQSLHGYLLAWTSYEVTVAAPPSASPEARRYLVPDVTGRNVGVVFIVADRASIIEVQ